MREALAGLTTRGRTLAAAGLATIVAAAIVGHRPLVQVGAFALALPLVAALWIARSRYRLALMRQVTPQSVSAGQSATVSLTVSNQARTPTGMLLLEDQLPYILGARPRFVLEGLGFGWRRHVNYAVRSDVRGVYDVGPMSVRVTDPFGLVELGRAFHATATLTVTPRVIPLPAIGVGGAWTGAGDNRPRAFAIGSAEDVMVREYRRGDDLRRVHWRSSARVGELMVRREEQPWQSRATVLLDNRVIAHRGSGVASSLEAAVTVAASVAVHLSQRGYAVRLVTAAGEDPSTAWHQRSARVGTASLLEALAVIGPEPSPRLDSTWLTEVGQGGTLIAVLGGLVDHDSPILKRMLNHSTTTAAICLDVDAWAPSSGSATNSVSGAGSARTADSLGAAGWRAVRLGPADSVAAAWQDLARLSARQQVRA